MPPPPPPCEWPSSFGNSATIASVVRIRPATDAAFCSAQRVTLVGSSTPISTRSPYCVGGRVVAEVALAFDAPCSAPRRARHRRWRRSDAAALPERAITILMPASWSWLAPLSAGDRLAGADQRNTAARHDAFFDRGTSGVQRIFHARLLFLHFHFGRSADLDQRHTAGQLGDTLLQLLAVVVAGGFVDLLADALDARFDLLGVAGAVDDGGLFLADFDALGLAQVVQGGLLQRAGRVRRRSPCRRSGWRCLPAWPCGDRRSPAPSPRRS